MSPRKRTGVTIRKRRLRSGDIHWQVRWREKINGRSEQFSEQFSELMAAEKFSAEVAARLGVVRAGKKTKIAEDLVKPIGDLDKLIPQFVAERKGSGKEGSMHPHLLQYRLDRLVERFGWKTTIDITHDTVEEMLTEFRLREQYSSAAHFVAAVKNFVGWAAAHYQVNDEVFRVEARPPEPAERDLWTDAQVYRILDFLKNPRSYAPKDFGGKALREAWTDNDLKRISCFYVIFRLQVLWAPRPVEASRLVKNNWDSKRRILHFPGRITKNGMARTFFVDPGTANSLDDISARKSPSDYLFTNIDGNKFTPTLQSQFMRDVLDYLAIPGELYCARHYACTRLANDRRLSIRGAMRITGHKTLSEFVKYLHVRDRELEIVAESGYADFVDKCSPPQEDSRHPSDEENPLMAMAMQ